MISLNLNIEGVKYKDYDIYFKFCYAKLSEFKRKLKESLNITKFNIRYDYVIDNDIIKFEGAMPTPQFISDFIINSFKLTKRISILGNINTAFIIPDYILIPLSNMSVTHFIRYLEYGTLDLAPYKWVSHTWYLFSKNIQEEWKDYKRTLRKLEGN